jgi:hypothetical protein
MATRRVRIKHELTLRQRLERAAEESRRRAALEPQDGDREAHRKRVMASEAALNMIDYLARATP